MSVHVRPWLRATPALALAGSLLGLASERARARADDVLTLSLGEALARAEVRAPEMQMAAHSVRQAQARRVGAGIVMPQNPRLSVDVRAPSDRGFAKELGYGATLDLLFEVGGAPAAREREATAGVSVARADQRLERMAAQLRVWALYLETQLGGMRIEQADSAVAIATRVLEAARKRVEVGAASDLELSSAELELAQHEVARDAARREREELLMALRQALDLPARTPLMLSTRVEGPEPLERLDAYLARAHRVHPRLAAAQARLAALRAQQERLERERVPRVGFYTGVDAAPYSPVYALLGVSVELPFAQRNQGPLASVASARAAEQTRRTVDERTIEREVVAAFHAYEARRAELERLTKAAVPAAERAFALADAGFRAGRFDWFRVALAARELVRTRNAQLDAMSATWAERVALEGAVGGPR